MKSRCFIHFVVIINHYVPFIFSSWTFLNSLKKKSISRLKFMSPEAFLHAFKRSNKTKKNTKKHNPPPKKKIFFFNSSLLYTVAQKKNPAVLRTKFNYPVIITDFNMFWNILIHNITWWMWSNSLNYLKSINNKISEPMQADRQQTFCEEDHKDHSI